MYQDYCKIDVRPTTGAIGAEIFGVDLSKPLDDDTFGEIHRAYLDHLVIFFRDQKITPEQQKAFALEATHRTHLAYIVTGDRDLLSLGDYEGITIVTPVQFLRTLAEHPD